jgi:hypothetical protein
VGVGALGFRRVPLRFVHETLNLMPSLQIKEPPSALLSVRIPPRMMQRIDGLASAHGSTRPYAVRGLLETALAAAEHRLPGGSSAG